MHDCTYSHLDGLPSSNTGQFAKPPKDDIVQCQCFPCRCIREPQWFIDAWNKLCHRLTSPTPNSIRLLKFETWMLRLCKWKTQKLHSWTKWVDSLKSTPCSWMTPVRNSMQSSNTNGNKFQVHSLPFARIRRIWAQRNDLKFVCSYNGWFIWSVRDVMEFKCHKMRN